MDKWKDPRPPVSVEWVGRYKVTIFDQALYNESLLLYPDDPVQPGRPARNDNDKPTFVKKKPASRWNWIVKPEQPLGKLTQEKGQTA